MSRCCHMKYQIVHGRDACDLFEYNHIDYLITVDYSNFFEVEQFIENKKRRKLSAISKLTFRDTVYQTW